MPRRLPASDTTVPPRKRAPAKADRPNGTIHAGPEEKANRPRVQSVARAAAILLEVARSGVGLSRTEISKRARVPTQATYHLLHTLKQVGLVARSENGSYVLGLSAASLAEGMRRQLDGEPLVSALVRNASRATGETAYAVKWVDGQVVSINMIRGRHHIQMVELPIGFSEDAHSRAGGKVLLAYADDATRNAYLERNPLRRRTPSTVCSLKELKRQLSEIVDKGYAVEKEEFAPGLCCLAVPVGGGLSQYAIGISVPVDRFHANFETYLKALQDVVNNDG